MVTINRILCPIDLSDFSRDALQHGLMLAEWYAAKLTILNVDEGDVNAQERSDELKRFCAPLPAASAERIDVVVRTGDAAKEIRAEAERLPADLLILGTHGRSGFERLFLGSVTEKVLRTTRVPVMTIPPAVREASSPAYKTILCALEFSDASLRALEYALSLAQEANARLILLHVIEDVLSDVQVKALGNPNLVEYYRRLEQDAAARLEAVVPDEARNWSRPEARVLQGRAYREILKTVSAERVDLVVMGVQGKSTRTLMFGSTTHRVIREAGCPVLTLHSNAAEATPA